MSAEMKENEHVRALASAAYANYTLICSRAAENEAIVSRYWDHPVFQSYMVDMGLVDAFAKFRTKP